MSGWNLRVDDRIRAKADRNVKGTVIACMPLGEYAVRFDDGKVEYGCREHLMEKIK